MSNENSKTPLYFIRVIMLVKGPGSPALCDRLEKSLDGNAVDVEHKIFPDGERYVHLKGDVSGEDCVLVHTTHPSENLLDLFFLQDAVFQGGASSLNIVVPYFSYGRQDQCFSDGEAISSRAIARRIEIEANSFYSIDLHSSKITDFFSIPATNLSAMSWLADHAELYDPDLFLSPDEGGIQRIKKAAEEVEIEWDYLVKERIDGETVKIEPKGIEVEGKTVVILDDIISTGGTMFEAAKQLAEQGADEVHVGCTHGIFVGDAFQRLKGVCDSIFCTDTIEGKGNEVTVAPLILESVFGIE